MANMALLNNIDHPNLKVISSYGAQYGDSVNQTLVFPTEFSDVQREYPIFFRKDAKDDLQAVAILGFERAENLFLDDAGWHARHVPIFHQKGPFLIGFQDQKIDGDVRREPVIYVDLDNPRVSTAEGQPMFLPQGGNTPYLEHVSRVLRAINIGAEMIRPMFEAFQAADLIEPISLQIRLDENTTCEVPELFTISEEKLAQLGGDTLEQLHRSGFLRLAYLAATSLANVNRLIELKNARRASAIQLTL